MVTFVVILSFRRTYGYVQPLKAVAWYLTSMEKRNQIILECTRKNNFPNDKVHL